MPDRVYLDLWFRSVSGALPRLRRALSAFPFSARRQGIVALRSLALDWAQPPLLDETYPGGLSLEELWPELENNPGASHGLDDLAYELSAYWDLWQFENAAWSLQPALVLIAAAGEQFDPAGSDLEAGHVRIEWSDSSLFLADNAPWNRPTHQRVRANLESLLAYVKKLEPSGLVKRKLSTESGWDLVQQLQARAYPLQ